MKARRERHALDCLKQGVTTAAGIRWRSVSPDNLRLPSFRVGKLSMIGEQWIVIEIGSRCPLAIRSASFIQGTRSLNEGRSLTGAHTGQT